MKKLVFGTLMLMMLVVPVFAGGSGEKKADEEIVLKWATIWVGKDSKASEVQALVDEFNAANAGKIKVEIDPQPDYNGYDQKIRISIAANTAPADIFNILLNPVTRTLYDSPILMDFTECMDEEWKADFDAAFVNQATYNGQLKSIPYETAILPLWYNMDMMEKAGVKEVPTNLNEMWSAFDKVKAAGMYPTSQMTGDTNAWTSMIWFSYFAVSLGGADVWDKPFTDPAFVEAAELLKRLIQDYSTPDAVGLGAGGSGGHFLSGRTAVFSNGPWYAGRADLAETPFFESVKIAQAPAVGDTKGVVISRLQSAFCAAASKDDARNDAIITFLKFMSEPVNVARLAKSSGAMFAINTEYEAGNHIQEQFFDLEADVRSSDLEQAIGPEATLVFAQQSGALALDTISAKEFCQLVEDAR